MAEYVLREDEDQEKVAQELLANADHPDHVVWRPRSGVAHGGVYEIEDGLAERLLEHRRAVAAAEQQRIEEAQELADERDSTDGVAEGLLTPAEAGFAANRVSDLGSGDTDEDDDQDELQDDARNLTDDEWREKYGDEPRPAMTERDATEDDDQAADDKAEEPAKPANRKSRRKTAPADSPELKNTEK